jgi:TIR domain
MPPTVAEVVDLVVRLEDDPAQRHLLHGQPHGIFRAAVDDGLIGADGIGSFAEVVGHAWKQGALGFQAQQGGAILPPPEAVWTDHAFQSRNGYHATLAGHQMAALFRQRRDQGRRAPHESEATPAVGGSDVERRDVFISHATEDKDTVARPLEKALTARGWSVWLDELELTIGDSLSGRIDAALARSRFGVVVLSPASFAKEWPQRELAGLAAKEVDAGSKVILPVWHEVDRRFVTQRSPILADRLGALTSAGIEDVADKVSLALERAGMRALTGFPRASVVQSVEPENAVSQLSIPSTPEEQARLVADRPKWWEYRLFAGTLVQKKHELEAKWDDHELRLPRGERREVDQASALDFLSREIDWMGKQVKLLDRILSLSLQEQAFGPRGEPGDPVRIEALSQRVITMYESLLDWAASLRAATVPEIFEELLEVTACFVDAPIAAIREFIDSAADQIARLPELAAGGTVEQPVKIQLKITMTLAPDVQARHAKALEQLKQALAGS